MASSRGTLSGPDWRDVTRAALEFSKEWGGPVTVTLRMSGTQKQPRMCLIADLWADHAAIGVVKPLVSASVSMATAFGTGMSVAALAALYELDKEVYRQEIGVSPPRR